MFLFFFPKSSVDEGSAFFCRIDAISYHIDKQRGSRGLGLGEVEDGGVGSGGVGGGGWVGGVHGDQWANKTNQWNETTEKSEVINLQRQDDPTNHMH